MRERGATAVTIEGVAKRAGVGKQTIYRWWPSRGLLLVDSLLVARSELASELPDTGDLGADLETVLIGVARVMADPQRGSVLSSVLSEMQHDNQLRTAFDEAVFEPIRARHRRRLTHAREAGQLTSDLDDDTLLDLAFGPLWFRLLTRPHTVTEQFARDIARHVTSQFPPPAAQDPR